MVSPSFGLAVKSTDAAAGEPAGPVTVAPVIVVETLASLKPKGETASSATCTEVAVGAVIDEPAETARAAEIGLLALVDHLLEAGARAVAVHDVIEGVNRRLVGGTAREQVAIAGLGIEQAQKLVRPPNRPSIAQWSIRCSRRSPPGPWRSCTVIRNIPDACSALCASFIRKPTLVMVSSNASERGRLRAQADREAAIETHARIGVGLLAGAELALQVVELGAHVDQRLHGERRAGADAGDAHGCPHMFIRAWSMSFTVESTRALAA